MTGIELLLLKGGFLSLIWGVAICWHFAEKNAPEDFKHMAIAFGPIVLTWGPLAFPFILSAFTSVLKWFIFIW